MVATRRGSTRTMRNADEDGEVLDQDEDNADENEASEDGKDNDEHATAFFVLVRIMSTCVPGLEFASGWK